MSNFIRQADGSYAESGSISIDNIAGNVVDDTQSITIPVSGVTPPPPPVEIPWTMIAIGGAVVVSIVVAIFLVRR